jgi:hypothetical protein
MIVIGLDVHKRSVTAVAVDEAGRPLDEPLPSLAQASFLNRGGGEPRLGDGRFSATPARSAAVSRRRLLTKSARTN